MAVSETKLKRDLVFSIMFILLGIIGGIILYKFLLTATQGQIRKLTQQIQTAEGELKRRKMMEEEVNKFEKEQLEMESKILKFKEMIPDTVDTSKIVEMLEELSKKFKFKETKVDILPLLEIEESGGSYYLRKIRVSFRGKYENLPKFLEAVRGSRYLLNIEELEVSRNDKIVPYLEVSCAISAIQSSPQE